LADQLVRQGGSVITAEKPNWLQSVNEALGKPSIVVSGAPNVRALVCDQKHRTSVHLLNLNVQRLSSFQDKVAPISDLHVALRVPFKKVHSVLALTADSDASTGALKFSVTPEGQQTLVETTVPRLQIATVLRVQ